jgi:hypothetical protein
MTKNGFTKIQVWKVYHFERISFLESFFITCIYWVEFWRKNIAKKAERKKSECKNTILKSLSFWTKKLSGVIFYYMYLLGGILKKKHSKKGRTKKEWMHYERKNLKFWQFETKKRGQCLEAPCFEEKKNNTMRFLGWKQLFFFVGLSLNWYFRHKIDDFFASSP